MLGFEALIDFGGLVVGLLALLAVVGLLCAESRDLMAVLAELCGVGLVVRFLRCEFCDEDPHSCVRCSGPCSPILAWHGVRASG